MHCRCWTRSTRWGHRLARVPAAAVVVALALAGCGGGDGTAGGATTNAGGATPTRAAEPAPATTARRPAPLGSRDHRLALTVDGRRRRFLLHPPPGHRRTERLALVVALHMTRDGADGKSMRDLTGLDAVADRERFLVAYPDSLDGRWNSVLCCNDTDDVGFVRALVEHARRRWGADPDRVYATGASSGAAMSYRLAAALPGVFAAIAPVSGALPDTGVPEGFPTSPVSLVAFHGRRDRALASMADGVAAWRRRAGCGPPRVAPYGASGQVTRSTARCRNGTEVVVYELAEMGHAWPGAGTEDAMAAPDTPVSATDLLWRFFEQHPRRRG
jgi:polyhydroxybutyrate depolymerase